MDDLNHVYVRDNNVRGGCTAVSVMFTGKYSSYSTAYWLKPLMWNLTLGKEQHPH